MCENIKKIKNLVFNNLVLLSSLSLTISIISMVSTNILAQTLETSSTRSTPSKIGGSRDNHGCLTGAGYSWCELGSSCIRYWELANCLETKSGRKFAREFNNFTDTYALDTNNNSQPNKALAAKKLCNPNNNFWDNISNDQIANLIQVCFPNSPVNTSSSDSKSLVSNNKSPSLITITDNNIDPMVTVPEVNNNSSSVPAGTIWCDTMQRYINPLTDIGTDDPENIFDFCNPAALDTPDFF